LAVTVPVCADVQYAASGEDVYGIESAATTSKVSYAGSEVLTIRREGADWRFEARAQYTRTGAEGKAREQARFVQVLLPDGTFEDRVDDDPDFLTILNQPFAVRLDAATLRELRALRGQVPFSATSPLGAEAVLHGFLRRAGGGPIDGRQTAAVRFEAQGEMTGPLPGSSQALISGTMRMDGVAYYAIDSATLLALNVTLTVKARLAERESQTSLSVPVQIVYTRSMRASKMPQPAPLATGAGTAAPATP
jgi:hypothetical protein